MYNRVIWAIMVITVILFIVPWLVPDVHFESNRIEDTFILMKMCLPLLVFIMCLKGLKGSRVRRSCLFLISPLVLASVFSSVTLAPEAIHRIFSGDQYEDKLVEKKSRNDFLITLYKCRSPKGEEYYSLDQERRLFLGLKKSKSLRQASTIQGIRLAEKLIQETDNF